MPLAGFEPAIPAIQLHGHCDRLNSLRFLEQVENCEFLLQAWGSCGATSGASAIRKASPVVIAIHEAGDVSLR